MSPWDTSATDVPLTDPNKCNSDLNGDVTEAERERGETEGHSDGAEKRNSVNPPLIRYNGSLVVCPVRTHLAQVCVALSVFPGSRLAAAATPPLWR